ncbi:unnamed protein product [Caretta caretta]
MWSAIIQGAAPPENASVVTLSFVPREKQVLEAEEHFFLEPVSACSTDGVAGWSLTANPDEIRKAAISLYSIPCTAMEELH